jgi:hypothetical protein
MLTECVRPCGTQFQLSEFAEIIRAKTQMFLWQLLWHCAEKIWSSHLVSPGLILYVADCFFNDDNFFRQFVAELHRRFYEG